MSRQLRQRWKSTEGQRLENQVIEYLMGASSTLPTEIGEVDGRRDLRGITFRAVPGAMVASARGLDFAVLDGISRIRDVTWSGLDLSDARLDSLRMMASTVENCRFDRAGCTDWRLWASTLVDCAFIDANLRDAAIGTWQDNLRNEWRNVRFDGADMRNIVASGCLLESCSFANSRLTGAAFDQAQLDQCTFSGTLRDVMFDLRELPRRPPSKPMTGVDFSQASFVDVDFRGCEFTDVRLPAGVYAIPGFPAVARRTASLISDDDSIEAQMLSAELEITLKMPGSESSVGVFNRRDYEAAGGESFADFVQSLFLESSQPDSS